MDFDQLKYKWRSIELTSDGMEQTNRSLARRLSSERVSSMKKKFMRHYLIIAMVGFLLPAYIPVMYEILPMSGMMAWAYGGFGVCMGILNLLFVRYVSNVDLVTLPTADALRQVIRINVYRRRLKMMGCILVVPVLALFGKTFRDAGEPLLWIAAVVGAVAGVAISVAIEIKNRRMLRRIRRELESLVDDDGSADGGD